MKAIKKTVFVGATKDGKWWRNLYVFITLNRRVVDEASTPPKRGWCLSISGVYAPTPRGNAISAGQCTDTLLEVIRTRAQPKGALSVKDMETLLDAWREWHLNDMRSGCEHQRRNTAYTPKELELVTYKLTSAAISEQSAINKRIAHDIRTVRTASVTEEESALLSLPYITTTAPDGVASGRYEVKSRDRKFSNWVRAEEHPEGLLCKPCDVCGYKYGSAWLYEEVPESVVAFLDSLPATNALDGTEWSR